MSRRAVADLGASDGYVFVFSPFNCTLNGEQIDAMNQLAERHRRSAVILTAGPSGDDSTGASAVSRLGLRVKSKQLSESALRSIDLVDRLQLPVAIALRRGEVIGIVAGKNAERIDSWIAWIEQRAATNTP